MFREGLGMLGVLAGILALVFVLSAFGLFQMKFWGPKYEAARRDIFVETPSYVQGKAQYLSRLHFEWKQADGGQRTALCALARQEASTIDSELLPGAVRSWECVR